MSILPEFAADPTHHRAAAYTAFGLLLDVDPAIDASALGLAEAPGMVVADTRIRVDPEELERRWSSVAASADRMRELRAGDTVVLSVDLAEAAGYLLESAEVGRVLVTANGSEVLCDPLPESSDWTFILSAQALPLASTLQGREVFHASAVVSGGRAMLFAGDPGAGKSSLAAAFVARGASLLGDDAIALERIDGSLVAHPSVGTLFLREQEHERLSLDERASLGEPSTFANKHRYESAAGRDAVPFGALFLLERAERGPSIEQIDEVDPFDLLAATFNLSVRTPERLIRQLDAVEDLNASGRIYRLRITPGTNATQLADQVEGHLLSGSG